MLSAAVFFTSCHKDEVIDGFGDLVIEMDNIAGSSSLTFGSKYVTANGDTVQFSTFNYYVSNFVLVNEDESECNHFTRSISMIYTLFFSHHTPDYNPLFRRGGMYRIQVL
jgi:hypothetical protein